MNKYFNKKVTINGESFDSKKEAKRYQELLLLQRAGKISNLQRQVRYELIPAQYQTYERYSKKGERLKDGVELIERKVEYVADFVYTLTDTGENVVEDVKGYKSGAAYDMFKLKRKLMLAIHSIRIKEV